MPFLKHTTDFITNGKIIPYTSWSLCWFLNHRCTFWNNEIIKSPQNEKAVEYTSIYLDLFEKLDELLYGPDSWEDAIDL